jgi:glycosyltransferase involved in cell wall biosynthesis
VKRILILANNDVGLYKFRKELIEELVKKYEVHASLPYGEYVPILKEMGCRYIETPISRRGTNPITDYRLWARYKRIIRDIEPDVVLTYTIKPNIYGGLACKAVNASYIANITGLGSAIQNGGILRKIILSLYKRSLSKAACVFFQNQPNRDFFINEGIVSGKHRLIPGSGVNTEEHRLEEYPDDGDGLAILFIGRIMREKGIGELMEAAERVHEEYPHVRFYLLGDAEEDYTGRIRALEEKGVITYYGHREDVHAFIKNSHATVLPSYHEGLSNVLLESASSGRPVLASRVAGCSETFDEGVSGFGFEVRDAEDLTGALIRFIDMPWEEKKAMGIAGRRKMEKEFDRTIVINAYMEEITKIVGKSYGLV